MRLAPITVLAAALLLGAAPASPPAGGGDGWERAARELHLARLRAEDALAHAAEGRTGPRASAAPALQAMLDAADAYAGRAAALTPRLLAAGMPPAANDRHATYLASHRARRARLAALLPALGSARPAAAARRALAILAEASSGPPRDAAASIAVRHVRRLGPRPPGADFSELAPVRTGGPPSARDLGTPPEAVAAAAARLPSSWEPDRIAAWVRGNVDDAPFHASALGAAGCLRDRACGAVDAAALLMELLRARRVPARLAYGVVEADGMALAATLLGGGGRQEALDALHLGGVPAEEAPRGRIRFEHVWVRAHVGGRWIDLDAVLDPTPTPLAVAAPARAGAAPDPAVLLVRYLADPRDRTPYGADFLPEPSGASPVIRSHAPASPAIVHRAAEITAVPPDFRAFVSVAAGRPGEPPWLDLRVPLDEIAATGLLFHPAPPSTLDAKIAKALGGGRAPPHLVTATTRVSAGGRELAALPPLARGTVVTLTITLIPPNGTPIDVHGSFHTGAPAALTVVPYAPGPGWLPARWRDADADPTGAAGAARFCAATGAQFFADLLDETARLARRAGGRRFVSPSTVLVAGALEAPSGLARAPLFADAAGLVVDVGRLDQLLLAAPGSQPVAFEVASGAALSAWESRALEIATGLPAVSTVTATKAAAAEGGAPRVLRRRLAAGAPELASLSAPGRSEVSRAIASGLVAVLPRVPHSIGSWIGESYVLLDPRSGRGAYLLRGALRGAVTASRCEPVLDPILDGGDAGGTLARFRRGRAERALLAREGWPTGTHPTRVTGVASLQRASARREGVAPLSTSPWPPVGGRARVLAAGRPIALSGVGTALWMGRHSRVLDPAVIRTFANDPPRGFDPKTGIWVGPTAMAVVPVDGEGRLLPVPARY